ncbi:MAG: PqiC family protein [Pseudomonadota bacterium]|uniref:Membrane integrity-associated transporter subunit PqiC n=1 Tax=Candidatus Desulfatibia profunda TaxID=2841695 RepID=A0A8J6NRT8_9BACT|nr:membrane integrity-associated transporter subunit PqiC [Candidatus Desulfatibia profunda]MBL7180669.1 membrane integrity-associated transporter subunit PqiC [Desulfobacterales bacterium]
MRNTTRLSMSYSLIFLAALTAAGCMGTSPPAAFFTLSALPATEMESSAHTAMQDLAIGIGPAKFPEILNRPQIITRSGPNRLTVSEFHRWGGRLDQDFLKVLAQNISILLATNRVVAFPWEDQVDPTYRIAFDIQQFDGRPGDAVWLNVTWTIKGQEGNQALYVSKSVIQQPVQGETYDALVAAHSQALDVLSREIAAAIKSITPIER